MTNHRPALLGFLTVVGIMLLLSFCTTRVDRGETGEGNWLFLFEDSDKSHFFVDGATLDRTTPGIIRVRVKFVPSEGAFIASMKQLSKEFGQGARPPEHTISLWELDCNAVQGRCLSLTHFRGGKKVASYDYPEQKWSPLAKGSSTRVLQEIVCEVPKEAGR